MIQVQDLMQTILRMFFFPMYGNSRKEPQSLLRKDAESTSQAQEAQILPIGLFYPPILPSSHLETQGGDFGFYSNGCP